MILAHKGRNGEEGRLKALLFSLSLFLILVAYYQLKPLSRTLVLNYIGGTNIPYVWIATLLLLITLFPLIHWKLSRLPSLHFACGTCFSLMVLLVLFRYLLNHPTKINVVSFYVLVDVYIVVLIETLWSLVNSSFNVSQGESWYGVIASGSLLGGVVGGFLASLLLSYTPLAPIDLIYVSAVTLLLVIVLLIYMGRTGYLRKADSLQGEKVALKDTTTNHLPKERVLFILTLVILLSQLVEPIVEYQFLNTLQGEIQSLKAQTIYLSSFFAVLSGVALVVNLTCAPLVQRLGGSMLGLLAQPFFIFSFALGFLLVPTLLMVSLLKIADRGLSYSINRASKELLYVPFEEIIIFKSKMWIDMFGYRFFKLVGGILVLCFTQWLPLPVSIPNLSLVLAGIVMAWMYLVVSFFRSN